MKLRWLFFLLLLLPLYSICQETNSEDSSYSYFDEAFSSQEDSKAPSDSSEIIARNFDAGKVATIKSDPDFNYEVTPTIAESLWDRLLLWLGQFLEMLVDNAVTTNWGRLFSYLLGIALIVALVMMLLRVNAFKVFYGERSGVAPYHVLHENIHEMDFDALIQEAITRRDYRKGIRLLFLRSLKMLADKDFIHWEHGKTNHDYIAELTKEDLKKGFNELNFYFENAWYGNFSISHEMFLKVQHIFTDWSRNIR